MGLRGGHGPVFNRMAVQRPMLPSVAWSSKTPAKKIPRCGLRGFCQTRTRVFREIRPAVYVKTKSMATNPACSGLQQRQVDICNQFCFWGFRQQIDVVKE